MNQLDPWQTAIDEQHALERADRTFQIALARPKFGDRRGLIRVLRSRHHCRDAAVKGLLQPGGAADFVGRLGERAESLKRR